MYRFIQLPIFQKLAGFFRQGTTPQGLALSFCIGVLMGVFPMLGVSTWFITLLAVRTPINLPLTITLSYLVWPIQVILVLPFMRMGEWMFAAKPLPLSLEQLEAAFSADFFGALGKFWDATLYALSGWGATAIPTAVLLYVVLFQALRYFFRKRQAVPPLAS